MVRGKHSLNFFLLFFEEDVFSKKKYNTFDVDCPPTISQENFINAFFSNDKCRKTKSRRVKLLTAEYQNSKAIKIHFIMYLV